MSSSESNLNIFVKAKFCKFSFYLFLKLTDQWSAVHCKIIRNSNKTTVLHSLQHDNIQELFWCKNKIREKVFFLRCFAFLIHDIMTNNLFFLKKALVSYEKQFKYFAKQNSVKNKYLAKKGTFGKISPRLNDFRLNVPDPLRKFWANN